MKIILCGNVIPETIALQLPQDSPAVNKYLQYLMDGFKENGCNITSLSYIAYKNAKTVFEANKNAFDRSSFVFKDKFILPSVILYRRKLLNSVCKGDIVIFYNFPYFYWGLVKKLEKKGIRCVLILADHDSTEDKKSFIRKRMLYREEKEIRNFHYSVLLSSQAKRFISPDAKMMIMEGGIKYSDFTFLKPAKKNQIVTLLYAGTLSKVTGIDCLLQTFVKNSDKNLRLVITGKGPLENLVKEYAQNDSRIEYKGFVSVKEYLSLVESCNILVNPRNMAMKENQFNFPSKILEYITSGRPVISTKFPGYERFTSYINFYDGDLESLNNIINSLTEKDQQYYDKTYEKNREFANTFDWKIQTKRILDMIQE